MSPTESERLEREDALFRAYAAETAVPPMWSGIEARLRRDAFRRAAQRRVWTLGLAAAASVIVVVLAFRRPASPVALATAQYESAIHRIESRLETPPPLLSELTTAVDAAKRSAASAPDDPVAVTRLVAAYDAKLDLLRSAVYEQ